MLETQKEPQTKTQAELQKEPQALKNPETPTPWILRDPNRRTLKLQQGPLEAPQPQKPYSLGDMRFRVKGSEFRVQGLGFPTLPVTPNRTN